MTEKQINIIFIVSLITFNISLVLLLLGLAIRNEALVCVGFVLGLLHTLVFVFLEDK